VINAAAAVVSFNVAVWAVGAIVILAGGVAIVVATANTDAAAESTSKTN